MKYAELRKLLAQLSANPRELAKRVPEMCRGTVGAFDSLKYAGAEVSTSKRDELLGKLAAGEHVEVEIDILAYAQEPGVTNRKFLRFRDGAMVSLARSGKGTPFLRDHEQWNSLAVAGEVLSSTPEKLADGKYEIRQTVRLKAKWAVELALQGLLGAVSIGWNPTGPVLCSAHNAPIFSKCYCWPGDELAEVDGEGGGKRLVRKAGGSIKVEFIYTEAELVETSMVPIGGVRPARVEDVRAAFAASLSASNPALAPMLADGLLNLTGPEPEEMPVTEEQRKQLCAILGLPDTTSVEDVLAAAKKLQGTQAAAATAAAVTAIQESDVDRLTKEIAELNADKAKRDQDTFIADALSSGRIAKGDEEHWRSLFGLDAKRAVELMGKRPASSATPVGAPMQSAVDPGKQTGHTPVITIGGERPARLSLETREIRKQLAKIEQQLGTSPKALEYATKLFGYEDPRGALVTLGNATSIANNADLDAARIGFHAAFLQNLEQNTDDPIQMLYTTVPSTRTAEEWNWMGDLPGFEEWTADRKMSGLEGFKLRVTNKKWSSGLRIKNDDVKDDALGLVPPQISGLATKARRHRWDLMIKMLLNGFDGTAYPDTGTGLGYDGAFFFADSHRGGNDNKMAVALDAAGLTAAELLLASMTTYDGADPLDLHGTHLIVGPKLRAAAEKLLTQERLANGEDNYHRGKYKLIVSNRIRGTYDDYWFLADLSQPVKPLLFQMREEISTSAIIGQESNNSVPSFINDELWFGAQARYNVGYFEHRLVVGSAVA